MSGDIQHSHAVRLFEHGASAVVLRFTIVAIAQPRRVDLCRLDSIPLALLSRVNKP